MCNQEISLEHKRTLANYQTALRTIAAKIEAELAAIENAQANGLRFPVSHAIANAAMVILATDAKMQVFSNLTWE